jgi:nucleoid-associated protein YgaU
MGRETKVGWLVIAAAVVLMALLGIRKLAQPVVAPPDASSIPRHNDHDGQNEPTILQAYATHGESAFPPGLRAATDSFPRQPSTPTDVVEMHSPATLQDPEIRSPLLHDAADNDLPARLPKTEVSRKKAGLDDTFEVGHFDSAASPPTRQPLRLFQLKFEVGHFDSAASPHYGDVEPTASELTESSSTQQIVQANDSFWWISQRAYGRGDLYKALYMHNRHRFPHPDRLPEGQIVDTPSVNELYQSYPQFCPNR